MHDTSERFNGRRPSGPRNDSGFLTDWKAAVNGIDGQVAALRETMPPRQYAEVVHQLWLRLDRERRNPHVARWLDEAA